ncbi:hypothetical protein [Candidatus Chloroploca sp. Khr17]|uniref:hypothetical protein n=1 Tax=Candidatus Chloroploca sp. Khr17 TaxID=2496869 RepID=UPI00196A8A98|nr:hypothetical protein [Candidatus Chloroploca sp. Khr17]
MRYQIAFSPNAAGDFDYFDFFVKHYPEPIFEDGIQLFDMLRLTLRYSRNGA